MQRQRDRFKPKLSAVQGALLPGSISKGLEASFYILRKWLMGFRIQDCENSFSSRYYPVLETCKSGLERYDMQFLDFSSQK